MVTGNENGTEISVASDSLFSVFSVEGGGLLMEHLVVSEQMEIDFSKTLELKVGIMVLASSSFPIIVIFQNYGLVAIRVKGIAEGDYPVCSRYANL